MANERFTDLPLASPASETDILCAVQGFVDNATPGTSVQMTLGQVLNLVEDNTILSNAGNPNGFVAGETYQLCWDTTNAILYVCNNTGSAATAVWKKCVNLTAGTGVTIVQNGNDIQISAGSPTGLTWNVTSAASVSMSVNNGYIVSNAGTCTLTLPAVSSVGDLVAVTSIGGPGSGWTIAQNAGQRIVIGNTLSLIGTGGSVSSSVRFSSLYLLCVVANTSWQQYGTQGELNVVTA